MARVISTAEKNVLRSAVYAREVCAELEIKHREEEDEILHAACLEVERLGKNLVDLVFDCASEKVVEKTRQEMEKNLILAHDRSEFLQDVVTAIDSQSVPIILKAFEGYQEVLNIISCEPWVGDDVTSEALELMEGIRCLSQSLRSGDLPCIVTVRGVSRCVNDLLEKVSES